MRNFEGQKALNACNETDLPIGTCFDITLHGVPVRRGVICETSPLRLAWFLSKSATASNLFPLDADFNEDDKSNLNVQPVAKILDFTRRLPATIRARGTVHRMKGKRTSKATADVGNDFIHPQMMLKVIPVTEKRAKISTPGCSPPDSPRPRSKRVKTTVGSNVAAELEKLRKEVSEMKHMVNKMRRRLKKSMKNQTGNATGGEDTVDWS